MLQSGLEYMHASLVQKYVALVLVTSKDPIMGKGILKIQLKILI